MRNLLTASIMSWALLAATASAPAQAQVVGGVVNAYGVNSFYGAPGYYGTTYGVASFGFPRTYTAYSSPFGAGYVNGYPPYGVYGRYGVGLWRPGFAAPGYLYGTAYYQPLAPLRPMPYYPPPIGAYAPGLGPPGFYAW